jgi:hypothetical protein
MRVWADAMPCNKGGCQRASVCDGCCEMRTSDTVEIGFTLFLEGCAFLLVPGWRGKISGDRRDECGGERTP